jgi:pilus assembly protein Flp/PilA
MKGAIMKTFLELLTNQNGATAIEYGLIAALISIAAIAALTLVGKNLTTTFNHVGSNLTR